MGFGLLTKCIVRKGSLIEQGLLEESFIRTGLNLNLPNSLDDLIHSALQVWNELSIHGIGCKGGAYHFGMYEKEV